MQATAGQPQLVPDLRKGDEHDGAVQDGDELGETEKKDHL